MVGLALAAGTCLRQVKLADWIDGSVICAGKGAGVGIVRGRVSAFFELGMMMMTTMMMQSEVNQARPRRWSAATQGMGVEQQHCCVMGRVGCGKED